MVLGGERTSANVVNPISSSPTVKVRAPPTFDCGHTPYAMPRQPGHIICRIQMPQYPSGSDRNHLW